MDWNIDWWKNQTKKDVVADMKLYATSLTDDTRRAACYGDNKANWPRDCQTYG